jgi:RES domain-containing protein
LTRVCRIGCAPQPAVDGQAFGSTLAAGRWHTPGPGPAPRRVVDATESRALAQLEKRTQANGEQPRDMARFALELPDDLDIPSWTDKELGAGGRDDIAATRRRGDAWLDARASLAVRVPSFVEPSECNLLINPEHPRIAEVRVVVERDPFLFDPRLGPFANSGPPWSR